MIQPARPADGPALLALAQRHSLTRPLEPGYLENFWQIFLRQAPEAGEYHFLLDWQGTELAACACYGPRPLTEGTYDIYCLAGTSQPAAAPLLETVVQAILGRHGRLILAESSSLPAHAPAQELFFQAGLDPEVTIPDFYHPGDDLVIFTRHLSEPASSVSKLREDL